MKTSDGGPAFPRLEKLEDTGRDAQGRDYKATSTEGMTLRDYFAAAALPGLIGGRRWDHTTDNGYDVIEAWAKAAYETADAMITARTLPNPT